MKSIIVCALMISVVLGSMGGAQDPGWRLQRANETPSNAQATDDGSLLNVEAIEGNRFAIYQVLGTLLFYVKGQSVGGIVALTENGQKMFAAKTDAKAPYMESNLGGAFEVKEIQIKSQLWIAPNGTKWRESIDNSGNITKVQVTP